MYPTKLNEYLGMGVPVVATGLPEIKRLNKTHGDIVAIANDADAFATELQRAIEQREASQVDRRIAVARGNSWDARLEAMSGIIGETPVARRTRQEGCDATLRRLYRTACRRSLRTAAIAAALYLLAFHTALLWIVAERLRVVDTPRQADAIAVFAGGAGESAQVGGDYQERVKQGVNLYREGYALRMIFSSGFVYAFREAEVMRGLACDLGVPADAITLEERAGSTYENVVFVRDIARQTAARTVLLVSSPYHRRRAVMTWRKQAPDVEVIATPVPMTQYYAHGYGASVQQFRGIPWEYAAIVLYRSRGWI